MRPTLNAYQAFFLLKTLVLTPTVFSFPLARFSVAMEVTLHVGVIERQVLQLFCYTNTGRFLWLPLGGGKYITSFLPILQSASLVAVGNQK
jgi:hypothetical protein